MAEALERPFNRLARRFIGPTARLEHWLERPRSPVVLPGYFWPKLSLKPVKAQAPAVDIFGSTLGGSWKTPLVSELARQLAAQGLSVGVWFHPVVALGRADSDEARLLRRKLEPHGVQLAPRGEPFCGQPDVILADNGRCLPQAQRRFGLLVLDGPSPWGNGLPPPLGNCRSHPGRLRAQADGVVWVYGSEARPQPQRPSHGPHHFDAHARWHAPAVPFRWLSAMARPERLYRGLGDGRRRVREHVRLPDHGRALGPRQIAELRRIWQAGEPLAASPKCREVMAELMPDAPLDSLSLELGIDPRLLTHLHRWLGAEKNLP